MSTQYRTQRRPRRKEATSKRAYPRKQPRQATGPPVTVERSKFLCPERLSVKLQFTGAYDLNNAGFKDAGYVFRPTSPYDVDPSIGGASSYGLAEYANFYSKYRVYSSKISLYLNNTEQEGSVISITPSTDNPGLNPSDIGPYISNPLTKFRPIGGFQGNSAAVLSHYMTTQRMAGVSTTAEDGYSSLVTTNPVENWYWIICLVKTGLSNLTYGASMVVKIEMTVHFYDRKTLATTLYRHPSTSAQGVPFPPPIPVYLTTPPSLSPQQLPLAVHDTPQKRDSVLSPKV